MKNRITIIWLLVSIMALPAFARAGDPDQAKPQARAQAQVSQATLLLRPDLAMDRIWIVKAGLATAARPPLPVTTLKKGVKYQFCCRYSNNGHNLSGFWKLGYYIDGQMVWNQSWGNVPAGEVQTKTIDYVPTTTGAHAYECQLDYDKEVSEKDETNNKAKIAFTVIN